MPNRIALRLLSAALRPLAFLLRWWTRRLYARNHQARVDMANLWRETGLIDLQESERFMEGDLGVIDVVARRSTPKLERRDS